jgi:hypothetical protein
MITLIKIKYLISKHKRISALLVSAFVSSLFSFVSRWLILNYLNIDIFTVSDAPFLSLFMFFNCNLLRLLIKDFLEGYLNQPLKMNINDILNPPLDNPSQGGNPTQAGNQPQGSRQQGNNPPQAGNPSQVGNQPQGSNQQGNNPGPVGGQPQIIQGTGYVLQNGVYVIDDPTNIANRGYIDPQTAQPYVTSQPYAKNMASAMQNHSKDVNMVTCG